jgi:hypothetical protein
MFHGSTFLFGLVGFVWAPVSALNIANMFASLHKGFRLKCCRAKRGIIYLRVLRREAVKEFAVNLANICWWSSFFCWTVMKL